MSKNNTGNIMGKADLPLCEKEKKDTDLTVIVTAEVMRGSRKFCQRGSNSDFFCFLVDEELEDPNTTKNRPSSARQRNAI